MDSKRIICAGILVADIFVPPLDALPEAGELVASDDFLIRTGGCAANTAACLTRLGHAASVIGCVGKDMFGDFVETDLGVQGIDTTRIRRVKDLGTSKTVILPVQGQDRRYIHTVGANADFTEADLPPALVCAADFLYLGGYLVLPGLKPVGLADRLALVRQAGGKTLLDVAVSHSEDGSSLALLEAVLPFVDLFMPNETEASCLTGLAEPVEQAARFLGLGCGSVVITMGPRGAIFIDHDRVIRIPAAPIESVDESGAGDAFSAGLIAGMVEGKAIEDSLRLGAAVGASVCRSLGCHSTAFTADEARQFLLENDLRLTTEPRPVTATAAGAP